MNFERADKFAIKRRKPHAKAIRRTGTFFFLLAIGWLILPVVLAAGLLMALFMEINDNLIPLIYLGVEAILLILAIMLWVSSVKGQKGTLTILYNKLHYQFRKKSIDIKFDDILSDEANFKKGIFRVYFINPAKKDRWFPNLKAHGTIEIKSKAIIDIDSSFLDATAEYREYKEKSEKEFQLWLNGNHSSNTEQM